MSDTIYPITHKDGTKDKRYTITSEYCGYETKRNVARFCGGWLGQSLSLESATQTALWHRDARNSLCITEDIDS